jgi:predicted XRE-type DNA-binding protein
MYYTFSRRNPNEVSQERLLKARLAGMIYHVIDARGWTQKHAAKVLGITQPDVSNMINGRLKNFSVERLIHLLGKLEQRVTITVQDETNALPPQKIVIPAQKVIERVPAG